jgi:hypothetical protein
VEHHPDRLHRVGDADLAAGVGAQAAQVGQFVRETLPGQPAAQVLDGLGVVDLVQLVF